MSSEPADTSESPAQGSAGGKTKRSSMNMDLKRNKFKSKRPTKSKPIRKKSSSSAKKKYGFEIEGEIVKDEEDVKEIEQKKRTAKERKLAREQTKERYTIGRTKPSILEKDRERALAKIATKGVVKLFNIVQQQQKTVEKKLKAAGKSERKKEKIIQSIDKKHFLDVLTGSVKSTPLEIVPAPKVETNESQWDILRDDFMMTAKLKDWDKDPDQ